MGTIAEKLSYLDETREQILTNINALGGDLTEEDTFRSYANELDNMWEELPHSTGEGETLSLNTKKGKMKVNLLGNTSQTGTPTPSTPIDVNVVSGDNTITTSNGDNTQSTSYPIHLGDKELCKIGDYQDRFFKNIPNTTDYNSDLEDNEWYLEKKIGKYTFTGNEVLSLQNNGKRVYVNSTASSIPDALHTTSVSQKFGMYCNKLVEVTAGQTWGGTQGISYDYNSGGNTGNFDISINGISTLEAYRTAIAGIILYYILQTPTYTPITGTLKDELESAWRANSYNGTTNISQVNNDLPFNLNVTALARETE